MIGFIPRLFWTISSYLPALVALGLVLGPRLGFLAALPIVAGLLALGGLYFTYRHAAAGAPATLMVGAKRSRKSAQAAPLAGFALPGAEWFLEPEPVVRGSIAVLAILGIVAQATWSSLASNPMLFLAGLKVHRVAGEKGEPHDIVARITEELVPGARLRVVTFARDGTHWLRPS